MAAASALASGNLSSHLSRPHAASDSRLLSNLIKAERNYVSNLHSSVSSAHSASSALSAWGTSEAPDVTETSARVAGLLSACADVQSTHVAAIEGYRAALKDVYDREASIRNVVRDRDILVGRLIKASNKSANASSKSKKSPEERAEKVALAQRELTACENVLVQEELALVGVKRRTFKEALTMRIKTMGDAGAAMVEAAKEAILLLDAFDSNAHNMSQSSVYGEEYNRFGNNGQEWYGYEQQAPQDGEITEEGNYDRMVATNPNFENSSVTPSQSASQIYQPQFPQRMSASYSAPFRGIGETDAEPQRYTEAHEAESDSDEEDFRKSFGEGQETTAHQGIGSRMPAPHQLSADAGTHRSFLPYATENGTPGPTPPAKDVDRRLSAPPQAAAIKKAKKKSQAEQRAEQFGPPNTVIMPPIPTAPTLNTNGINLGPVPSAPKLYMPGASGNQDDSSDEEPNALSHRGGGAASSWSMRQHTDDASSDGARTAKQSSRPDGVKRSNSFFGKFGRLFKTDVKGEPTSGGGGADKGHHSTSWNTRTDALLRESRKDAARSPSQVSRRQRGLTGSLANAEPDSSDEEPIDERNFIRVTNPTRPLWQKQKANSELGMRKELTTETKKPGSLKRTPSASVTAGPMSWKAWQDQQDSAKRLPEQAAAGILETNRSAPATPLTKKKKKKTGSKRETSIDGGSEIGTQATRTRGQIDQPSQRHSVIVAGDASAGVRRSDSISYGSKKSEGVGRKTSKRHSTTGAISGMSPVDGQGKFSTSNWIAKSNAADETDRAMPELPRAPVAALTVPSKLKQSHTPAESNGAEAKHVPQPSATMSPPLKPALKIHGSTDLARTGSISSSVAGNAIPILPPPVSAPPPVTSLKSPTDSSLNTRAPQLRLPGDEKRTSGSVLSIEEDKRFDGTGQLGVSAYSSPTDVRQQKGKGKRAELPRIDMPTSEPFRVDYDPKHEKQPMTPMREGSAGELLTPGEKSAYQSYILQNEGDSPERLHEGQPSGVTRFTDRIASVGRGFLGKSAWSPPKPTATSGSTNDESAPQPPVAFDSAPGKLSRTYSDQKVNLSSDSSEDEATTLQKAESVAAPPLTAALPHLPAKSAVLTTGTAAPPAPDTATSSIDGGSTIGRRKSVRMAPDVKLPPEAPTDPVGEGRTFNFNDPSSALSSRIAPPPPAPPRASTQVDKAYDIGARSREVQGWSIRTPQMDDSSDEDEGDDYEQARKSFGSASKTWGQTTKKKGKKSNDATARPEGEVGSLKKKKKKTGNAGYNPSIPLPAGMEVVGRSSSVRR